MLPNFLIIGAPRSGTTLLEKCLREHPDVFMPPVGDDVPGDIHFFNPRTEISLQRNFDKGLGWYEKLFEAARGEAAIGEKTAHYLCDPEAPRLIHETIAECRLIAILRNPVDRAYSEYWYHRGEIPSKMDFLTACFSPETERLKLLEAGLYYEQLQRYLKYFSREQMLILFYDDLKRDPLELLQTSLRFLEIDPAFEPSRYDQRINVALHDSGSGWIRRFGLRMKTRFPSLFRMLSNSRAGAFLKQRIGRGSVSSAGKRAGYPPMSVDDRRRLQSYFEESNRRLGRLLSRDVVKLWSKGPGEVSA